MTSSTRFVALDVLRGVAILGTLATNIWIFTNPEGMVGYLREAHPPSEFWEPVQAVAQQLAQGKFLGLLTVMFGIGLAIQQRSAERRGERWPGAYPWRALLLFVDGALNYVLFTEFDVLMGYAVTGLIVAYLLTWRVRRQWIAVAVAATVHVGILVLIIGAVGFRAADGTGSPLSPNPYADGSFTDLIAFRIEHSLLFRAEVMAILPMSIALFLIGAALLRHGILEPRGTLLRRRLMIAGFGVAAPLDVLAGRFGGGGGLILARYGFAPVVALGLLAAIAAWYARGRSPGALGNALMPIGRTALSCYVLQNAIAGAVCYGWGLGLSGRLDENTLVPATIGLFLAISAVLMVVTRLWLTRFDRGPLEWLWHAGYQRLRRLTDRQSESPVSPEQVKVGHCTSDDRA